MDKKISVLVPVYNVEKYVGQCIKSIVDGVYRNLEIIIIDDGSTDGSLRICEEWAKKDNRIKVIHQENKGISAVRNNLIKYATGDYIGFTDSDDYINIHMYEYMLKALEESGADIALCKVKAFYDSDSPDYKEDVDYSIRVENEIETLYHFTEPFTGEVSWTNNKLYRKNIIDGINFEEGHIIEDIMFESKVFSKVNKSVWVPVNLYYYRQRQGSLMNGGSSNVLPDFGMAMKYEFSELRNKGDAIFQEKHLYSCLNKILSYEVKAYKQGNIEAMAYLDDCYKQLYYENKSMIKDNKEKAKAFLYLKMRWLYNRIK